MDEEMDEIGCSYCGASTTDPERDGWCIGDDGERWCPECEQDYLDHLPKDAEGNPIGAPVVETDQTAPAA